MVGQGKRARNLQPWRSARESVLGSFDQGLGICDAKARRAHDYALLGQSKKDEYEKPGNRAEILRGLQESRC